MRTIITAIAFAIVSMIILATSANANSNSNIITRMDCDNVYYSTTIEGYDKYHNLSIEANGIVIHLDKVPHSMGPMYLMTIHTNKVMNIRENEKVDIISGTIPQTVIYNLRHQNHGTSVFTGEVNDEEVKSMFTWIKNMKNNQTCDLAIISNTGGHNYITVSFKNTSVASRCVNDILHR